MNNNLEKNSGSGLVLNPTNNVLINAIELNGASNVVHTMGPISSSNNANSMGTLNSYGSMNLMNGVPASMGGGLHNGTGHVSLMAAGYNRPEFAYGKEFDDLKTTGYSVVHPLEGVAEGPYGASQSGFIPVQQQPFESSMISYNAVAHPSPSEPGIYMTNYVNSPYYQAVNVPSSQTVAERLQLVLPEPPLSTVKFRPNINLSVIHKRAKRKSKFTKEQDEMIISLKKNGRSWVEIAEITGVGSYLAARNRYQVIVGQQGNNNSASWKDKDRTILQSLLDKAELEKWDFIASELSMSTDKNFTGKECRDAIKALFWKNPSEFNVNEVTVNECIRERKLSKRMSEQELNRESERSYVSGLVEPRPASF